MYRTHRCCIGLTDWTLAVKVCNGVLWGFDAGDQDACGQAVVVQQSDHLRDAFGCIHP